LIKFPSGSVPGDIITVKKVVLKQINMLISIGKEFKAEDLVNYEFPLDYIDEESYIKFPYPLKAYMTVTHKQYAYGHQNGLYGFNVSMSTNSNVIQGIQIQNVNIIKGKAHQEMWNFIIYFSLAVVACMAFCCLGCVCVFISHKCNRKRDARKVQITKSREANKQEDQILKEEEEMA
jgi:hypothetical protein